jgi:hypothetical protein
VYCGPKCRRLAYERRRSNGGAPAAADPTPLPVDYPERGFRPPTSPVGSHEDDDAQYLRPPPIVLSSGEVIG